MCTRFGLCQSASHGQVNCRLCFPNHKSSVQGTMRPHMFAYTAISFSPDPVHRNVQNLTACVRRLRLCQSAFHNLVNWHIRFRNRRPSVQYIARPTRFVYTASGTCTCDGLGAVRTTGIRICRLCQSASHGLVN